MKTCIEEFAILGGFVAFAEKLHVGCPNIGNREHLQERINEILDRRWLTNNGVFVQEFEQRIAEFLHVKHCIVVCNATVGLEIAIHASGMQGEVIVPSFTFIGTVHALQWGGITPVFSDIDPFTHNLDPKQVERMITPRTTGIIGVHLWGRVCVVETLTEIAQNNDLKLLFDAAHAFGCSYNGVMIGNFGNAEVFSFHATKFFNTFEGGAVVTNDDELAKKVRLMKNFGFCGNVISIGTNGKMSEVSAAMGLTGLDSLDELITINYRNYQQYQRELTTIPGIYLARYKETEKCNYQYIVLEIDEMETQLSRDQLMQILLAENVQARRYFYPGCHRMEPYHSHFPHAGLLLPETEKLTQRILVLPTGTAISSDDITIICQIIQLAVKHGREINSRIPRFAT